MEKEGTTIDQTKVGKGGIDVGEASKSAAKEKRESRVKEDRLSKLPDELIHRILSSVDAKSAVQTSVLSKRWKHVWTSLPILNFHDHSFDHPLLFHSFVHNFFSNRDSSTNVYAINFTSHDELDDLDTVDSIIDFVALTPHISTTIRFLNILAECVVQKLPQLSLCQSLSTLKLVNISAEIISFDFVSLQNLFLFDCRFECGAGQFLDPFQGCVNLKCLYLHGCHFYGEVESFKISAPKLVDLSISWMRVDEVFDSDCVVELFTPKLRFFRYCDSDFYDFSIDMNLPFMEEVDIDVGFLNKDTDSLLRLVELFEVMGSAEFVSLSPGVIEVLSMFPDLLDGRSSPFTKVKSFELNMDRPSSPFVIPANVMAYLFGGSPGFDFNGWEGTKEWKTI